ncbi:MAG TPA: hypothetical protein VN610_02705, partial [Bryobacteraceae bacterium]|nr:hypothetical protein [Bryobacteraceae bacterium]
MRDRQACVEVQIVNINTRPVDAPEKEYIKRILRDAGLRDFWWDGQIQLLPDRVNAICGLVLVHNLYLTIASKWCYFTWTRGDLID